MVWRQCYLPSNENELRQMHRTKWFSLPYWRFMELSSKELRIYIENRNERRKSESIIHLISHIFFYIHRLLNFENFLQVWKMLEFPISIHSLWSWEVSLILNVNLFRFWIFISSLDKMVWNDRHMERNIMYWRE